MPKSRKTWQETGDRLRVLEQGPNVSGLLTSDWVECRPNGASDLNAIIMQPIAGSYPWPWEIRHGS